MPGSRGSSIGSLIQVDDERGLRCSLGSRPVILLHLTGYPKPWFLRREESLLRSGQPLFHGLRGAHGPTAHGSRRASSRAVEGRSAVAPARPGRSRRQTRTPAVALGRALRARASAGLVRAHGRRGRSRARREEWRARERADREQHDATYVTVADEKFFLGAVALVNSLRLSGNPEPIVVMDAGLSPAQRALLSDACDVRPLPVDQRGAHQTFLKPAVMLELSGTAVWIDSDIIVTDRLEPILAQAASGKICAFPDGAPENHGRRVDEWVTLLGLGAELRPQVYVNAGFLAFRVDLWDGVVRRWWDLCDRVRVERSRSSAPARHRCQARHPFAYLDQDVLNGILMSEVEPESIHLLDWRAAGVADVRGSIRVVERPAPALPARRRPDGPPPRLAPSQALVPGRARTVPPRQERQLLRRLRGADGPSPHLGGRAGPCAVARRSAVAAHGAHGSARPARAAQGTRDRARRSRSLARTPRTAGHRPREGDHRQHEDAPPNAGRDLRRRRDEGALSRSSSARTHRLHELAGGVVDSARARLGRLLGRSGPPEGWHHGVLAAFARATAQRRVVFVQIGSNDGVTSDPLQYFVDRYAWSGILVEPVPHVFERLHAARGANSEAHPRERRGRGPRR